MIGIAERIAGSRLGEADARDDIAGAGLVERLLLVGVHPEETGNALLLVDRGVEKLAAELENARIDAHERDLAHVLVGHDLEREAAERRIVADGTALFGIVLADRVARVERRRQIVADCVEERLHALVLERAAAESGSDRPREASLADSLLDLVDRELLAREELLHQGVILLGRGFDHLLAVFLRLFEIFLGDVLLDDRLAEALHIEV